MSFNLRCSQQVNRILTQLDIEQQRQLLQGCQSVFDSDNDPEDECEGSGRSKSESEVVASTSRSKVRPRSRSRKKSKTTKRLIFLKKS